MKLLDTIERPEDIKALTAEELKILAGEVRQYMIDCVSHTGGHLAPSLGVVDLVIALCTVFDFPNDKIIFDVGHQSYAYKILTGRRDAFPTLRQWQGLAGFPKTEESEYDSFNTGHSSTSISAALGLAVARDLKGEKHEVIAVIGDGALTGGMAYEALNNAGNSKKNLIVVLNDNEMSIAANVGAMANYLNRARSGQRYNRDKHRIEDFLNRSRAGTRIANGLRRLKDSFKYLLIRGVIFEEMGFTYLGPIDGHDIAAMQRLMQSAKALRGPVLLHVLTKKGKGYEPAEADPNRFHGISPFDQESGKLVTAPDNTLTFSKSFGTHLAKLAGQERTICAITAAMPDGTGLGSFADRYPQRFFDVGIAEQHAVTFAAGLARSGLRPVVAVYSSFLQRGVDQVFHDVCLQKLPVVFAIDRAGVVGEDGETHQGLYDIAMLRALPNLTIMAPSSDAEMDAMLRFALTQPGPCALRYPRGMVSRWDEGGEHLPLLPGKGELIARGDDVLLIPLGNMMPEALKARQLLAAANISAAIINPRFVKPLDEDLLLREMALHSHVVTIEDHVRIGGFGSAVAELAEDHGLPCKLLRIGFPDEAVKQGKKGIIWEHYGVEAGGICAATKVFLNR